jgi:hypothetical protein
VTGRIGLVGCVKTKLDHVASAKDLYVSPLFRGRRAYVESSCSRWFILSAKHGLVDPDAILEPYDQTLETASLGERREWSSGVLAAIRQKVGDLDGLTFEAHAGSNYLDFGLVEGLHAAGAEVVRPAEGLGLFEQQAFYSSGQRRETPPHPSSRRRDTSSSGKYAPLEQYLGSQAGQTVTLRFEEVAGIVESLPGSARNHRAWWANHESHAQARAWLRAGWRVETVDLGAGRVMFVRGR